MQRSIGSAALCIVLGLTCLTFSTFALADDGRDFAGTYQTSSEATSGETVTLTLAISVTNYSGVEISDAVFTVHDPASPERVLGTFPGPVYMAARERVQLTTSITAPLTERERWNNGGAPQLAVSYTNANGDTVRTGVELAISEEAN